MATRRTILESLTRKDLLDLARAFDVAGLTAQSKADVVVALASARAFTTEDLLARFSRNQLKAACQAAGLPDHGREKQLLVDRLLGSNGQSSSASKTTDTPVAAPQSHATAHARFEKPMAKQRKPNGSTTVTNFRHKEAKRKNNPPATLAAEGTVPALPKAKYAYNPHLPPKLRFGPDGDYEPLLEKAQRQPLSAEEAQQLAQALEARQPWLEWAEKQEQDGRGQFEVDPVALHIHERVSAQAILKVAARQDAERSLFADPEQEYHEAVQFYRHDIDWTNRLILGDSMQVMSSLAHREDMAGKVQMIYIDPPYGIRFASNFQPEVGRRDVSDREKDLTREAEMVRAYRDTWHLGVHSYLSYLRDRLIVAKELLADAGSLFVQIGDENVHRVRSLLDEIFGAENGIGFIPFVTTAGLGASGLPNVCDYLLWYAKAKPFAKYHQMPLQTFVWVVDSGCRSRSPRWK